MDPSPAVRITYYLEVVSSWCWWAQPAWMALKTRYDGRVGFDWKIALMDASGFPVSRDQCEWFYRRSGVLTRSPYMLHSGWFDPALTEYQAPNRVAEAARDLGVTDDRVRLALAQAALREGRPVGRWEVAVEVAAAAGGLDPQILLELAQSVAVEDRCRATTAEFHALQVSQRPTFVLESDIGDRVVLSGVWRYRPIAAALDALLEDAAGYAAFAAHFGGPPAS